MTSDFYIDKSYNTITPELRGDFGKAKAGFNETVNSVFGKDKGVNGEIDEAVFQGNTGDCWLISGILSMSYTDDGAELIKNAITKNDDGSYTVKFDGVDKEYTITEDELESANKKGFLEGLGVKKSEYSTGDDDVLLIELAMEKLVNENEIPIQTVDGITGGSAYYFYQLFSKNAVEYAYGDDETEIKNLLEYYNLYQDECAATIGVETGFAGLEDDHAYAVKSINSSEITLVNPWDTTETVSVSIKDLASNIGKFDLTVTDNDVEENQTYLEEYYA